jgi:hypothetical protein
MVASPLSILLYLLYINYLRLTTAFLTILNVKIEAMSNYGNMAIGERVKKSSVKIDKIKYTTTTYLN